MIYTFYSYKGGVGRSMAVANVGEWLYLHGLRVVLVDWDLEAPGLEAFFPGDGSSDMSERPGLMDLLLDYKEDLPYLTLPGDDTALDGVVARMTEQLPPLRSRLQPLRPVTTDAADGALWLLSAGRRAGEALAAYAREVQRFDWLEFYERYRGEAFFEWLRRGLLADDLADVVLIDSRTGISEMGGVATRQLADVIVSFCVLNTQNIEGVSALTRTFLRPEVVTARGGRAIEAIVVPTRIESGEIDVRNWAQRRFGARLDDLTPEAMRRERRSFWDLRIPYVPKYAYRETLAVGASDSAEELEGAYERLARQLLALAPPDSRARERIERASQPPQPIAVPRISNVPPRLPLVVGRQAVLGEMHARLGQTRAPLVLYGLGGVGKTTLAIEYAHRFQPRYEICWWIDAASAESAARGYAMFAQTLQPQLPIDPQAVEVARGWLAAHTGWLLVLDGADDPAAIMPYVPTDQRGHVVITSRNPEWGRLATTIAVPLLERPDSVELLLRRTGDVDRLAADQLAAELGDLPLALEHASAYMEVTGRSIELYLKALKDEGAALLTRAVNTSAAESSVRDVWEGSYRELLHDVPAWDLLAVCSMLAPSVPVELIGAVPQFVSPVALDQAVVGLRRFSFVTAHAGELHVHPLLQSFVNEWLPEDEARRAAESAVVAVRNSFKPLGGPELRLLSPDRVLPHARKAVEHAVQFGAAPDTVIEVMAATAHYQTLLGDLEAALATMQSALAYAEGLPGAAGVDELLSRKAALEYEHGELQAARNTLERRHAEAEKRTAASLAGSAAALSLVLAASGDPARAEQMVAGLCAEASRTAGNPRLPAFMIIQALIEQRRSSASAGLALGSALALEATSPTGDRRETLLSLVGRVLTPDEVDAYVRGTRLRLGAGGDATAIRFSPSGTQLATAATDGSVTVWDVRYFRPTGGFASTSGAVGSVAFSPGGALLAAGGADGTVSVVRPDKRGLPGLGRVQRHESRVRAVAFSPDGGQLASVGDDGMVRVVEPESDELLATLDPGLGPISAVAFTPDAALIAIGLDSGIVQVLDVNGTATSLDSGAANVNDVQLSSDGRWLASASNDGTVRIYDVLTMSHRWTLTEHCGAVNAIAFSPDGRWLASASDDRTVRLWSVEGAEVAAVERHPSAVNDVAFAPDGHSIGSASDGGFIRLWDLSLDALATL